ncbi:hypothetical protein P5673_012884 [Acropora cervicornis]|uniref:Uncharacterized protein n=1 Tax=Acropora cervicornis TaxID=6130 RepID=A0AAD9QMA6_ACRCE|nr:hypothetical protein P5673_012884 [Acropora cervicornis]
MGGGPKRKDNLLDRLRDAKTDHDCHVRFIPDDTTHNSHMYPFSVRYLRYSTKLTEELNSRGTFMLTTLSNHAYFTSLPLFKKPFNTLNAYWKRKAEIKFHNRKASAKRKLKLNVKAKYFHRAQQKSLPLQYNQRLWIEVNMLFLTHNSCLHHDGLKSLSVNGPDLDITLSCKEKYVDLTLCINK